MRKRNKIPDNKGYFGAFGGRFIPETLMPMVKELTEAYQKIGKTASFKKELDEYLREYAGRPTPLYFAERLTRKFGGGKIYLKREDLLHTGAGSVKATAAWTLTVPDRAYWARTMNRAIKPCDTSNL